MSKGEIMKKIMGVFGLMMLFLSTVSFVIAAQEDEFAEAKELIAGKTSCNVLSDEQLDEIGDYYMEQMHPKEAHTLMEEMMGGEGSAQLKQMHTLMAKRLYCKENVNMMGSGMMGFGMISGGMMGGTKMMGYGTGMMGSSGWFGFTYILYVLLLLGLVIVVYLWIVKLWKSLNEKKR